MHGPEMGSGEKQHHLSFHIHLPHLHHHHHHSHHDEHHHHDGKGVPKGCMVIMVGREGEEELQRFVIPIVYVNHPLFMQLLKEAEEEYGFDQKGPITIPCHVEEFRHVQGVIDRDQDHHHSSRHHHHHHHTPTTHPNHNHHHFLCFKA